MWERRTGTSWSRRRSTILHCIKRESEVKINYIPLKKGYYVHVRCLDIGDDLLDMKLYAPDYSQAKYLGEQIMLNPAGFYGKILDAAFSNREEPFELEED